MKAIRIHQFGGPDVLKLEEIGDPAPGPGQVVVKMHAVGVNPVETYIRSGNYPVKKEMPFTPGQDGAGVVEAVGPGVREFKPGDRVYTAGTISGSYAQKALCDAATVHPLPAKISFAQGAAVGVPYGTAAYALFYRARTKPWETVLVHGASGGVGIACVQLARAAGMTVWGTAGSERGSRLVVQEGAHRVFDHHAPDYVQQIMAATGERGVDVILEMLANVNLAKDLGMVALKGRIAVIGCRGKIEIDPRGAMARDADIRGVMLGSASPDEARGIHRALVAGLENGTLRPVINQEMPLADAAKAHEKVMAPAAHGKIVLVP